MAEALADVLLDCVESGASVGFLYPLPHAKALASWQSVLASANRGERVVLCAGNLCEAPGGWVGTCAWLPEAG